MLDEIDLDRSVDKREYKRRLAGLQARLFDLDQALLEARVPAIIVFEGWAGTAKVQTISKLTRRLDPRGLRVNAITPPRTYETLFPWLHRFWLKIPSYGQIAIFDRSWYGRVLVERVEGFARPDEWRRAYAEINEFERQLIARGTIICKFWMHLSPEEQLRRFEERQTIPYKAWKLTDEDWRNRAKWPQYEEAADEMLARTSTPAAPWTIVESEDKRFARVEVLQTVARRLEDELGKVDL